MPACSSGQTISLLDKPENIPFNEGLSKEEAIDSTIIPREKDSIHIVSFLNNLHVFYKYDSNISSVVIV